MSYQGLARKWRPRTFQELTGQEHVTKTLGNAIRVGRIAQVYLFSGVRGVGKTTAARILAKSLNCSEGPTPTPCMICDSCVEISSGFSVDVVEIDGASHTGVDNVRELQESAQYAPLRGRYKIYIIDEVHMLSTSAFNALLKILEEPPPHVIFVFATTEPHKIPHTIHSRCQHFHFRRLSYREIMERLRFILEEEGIGADENALSLISRVSDGSMRDALSLLDQVIAYSGGNFTEGDVTWILGLADHLIVPFLRHILDKDSAKALNLLKDIVDGGYDLKQFCSSVVENLRNLTLARLGMGQDVIDLPKERIDELSKMGEGIPAEDLERLFRIFARTLEEMKWFPYPRFSLEMAVIKAVNMRPVVPVDELLARLRDMERRLTIPAKIEGPNATSMGEGEGELRGSAILPSVSPYEDKVNIEREYSDKKGDEKGEDSGDNRSDMSMPWREVVKKIHDSKPSLGSYLEQGVPLGLERGILTVGFNSKASFVINLLERKESKDFILKRVKDCIPGVAGIQFTTLSEKEGHSPAYDEYLSTVHEREEEEVEKAFSEPIVQEAIDILGGEVVEVRRRDGRERE